MESNLNYIQLEAKIAELTAALEKERSRPRVSFEIKAFPDNFLEGFGGYLAGEEIAEYPEIRINFGAIFRVCAAEGFDWKECVADVVVHELLHIVQHQFGLAFSELDVDESIERARALDQGNASEVTQP